MRHRPTRIRTARLWRRRAPASCRSLAQGAAARMPCQYPPIKDGSPWLTLPRRCYHVLCRRSAHLLQCSSHTNSTSGLREHRLTCESRGPQGLPRRSLYAPLSKSHASTCGRMSPSPYAGAGTTRGAKDACALPPSPWGPWVGRVRAVVSAHRVSQSERGLP
jgi:hypothetical protein